MRRATNCPVLFQRGYLQLRRVPRLQTKMAKRRWTKDMSVQTISAQQKRNPRAVTFSGLLFFSLS